MTFLFYIIIDFLAILLLFIAGNDVGKIKNKKGYINKRKILVFLSFIILLSVIVFRDVSVGTDYYDYIRLYNRIYSDTLYPTDIKWIGLPFYIIIKVFATIFGNVPILFYGLLSLLSLYLLYKTIIKESKIPWFSLLIFIAFCLYYQMFNQFRQLIAIIICLNAFQFLKEENVKKYFITIIAAACFHPSALVMMPMYFIKNLKITSKSIMIYILLCIGVFVGYKYIINILSFTNYGSSYFGTYRDIEFNLSTLLNLGVRLMMLLFCIFYKNNYIKNDNSANIVLNMLFICILFQVLTLRTSVVSRITTYYFIYFIIAVPNTIYYLNIKKQKLFITLAVLVLFAYHYVYYHSNSGAKICGYDEYKLIELGK